MLTCKDYQGDLKCRFGGSQCTAECGSSFQLTLKFCPFCGKQTPAYVRQVYGTPASWLVSTNTGAPKTIGVEKVFSPESRAPDLEVGRRSSPEELARTISGDPVFTESDTFETPPSEVHETLNGLYPKTATRIDRK